MIKFQELNEGINACHLTKSEAALNSESPIFTTTLKVLKEIELCRDTNDGEHSPEISVKVYLPFLTVESTWFVAHSEAGQNLFSRLGQGLHVPLIRKG